MSFHSYRGQPSTRNTGASSNTWSQAKTRHGQGSYDQHGRHLSWTADNRNGMPAGPIGFDFSAPWYPDQQYIRINPDDTSEAYIDYPMMFRDRKSAMKNYHQEAVDWCRRNKRPAPKLGQYDDDIIGACGKPPRALEMIAAASQEHPWVLGSSDIEDPRLVPFLESPSTDVEAELEEFDFSIESYFREIGQTIDEPGRKTATPFRRGPKKFTSLKDLEAAAADLDLPPGMDVTDGDDNAEDAGPVDPTTLPQHAEAMGEFDQLSDQDVVAEEPVGNEDEVEEEVELLDNDEDLDEAHDPEARGGRRVDPRKTDLERKKDARRPSQTSVPRKRGERRSAGTEKAPDTKKPVGGSRAWDPNRHKGKSMADGAKPHVGRERL